MFNFLKKRTKEPTDLKEILASFRNLEKNCQKLSEELENLKKESLFYIRKVGMVRFNPFKDIGGDQSFSVALLDGKNDGIVITSLYSREENRVYGKPIKEGLSEYALSAEEKEAIERARTQMKNEK